MRYFRADPEGLPQPERARPGGSAGALDPGGKISFRVDSGGCTDASSFKVRIGRQEGLTPKSAHYQLTIERVRIDECRAVLWEGVVIGLDLERDLGLRGTYTVSVANPVLSNLLAATVRAIELRRADRRGRRPGRLPAVAAD